MKVDHFRLAFLALRPSTSNPIRASWICKSCCKQARGTSHIFQSTRTIATRARTGKGSSHNGIQGLDNAEELQPSISIKLPERRPLTRTELRAIQRLDILLEDSQVILQKDVVPTEEKILEALKTCRGLADYFRAIKDKPALTTIKPGGEAGNLLFLEDPSDGQRSTPQSQSPTAIGAMASSIADSAMEKISEAVNKIAEDENVFITPIILQQVVEILALLGRPETLARIFILYASKPIPDPTSKPVKYGPAKPHRITSAVPLGIARTALEAGMRSQNLPLCLDIIEHTVCTTAYKKAKILRKALLPASIAIMAPFGSYILASRIAELQHAMSTTTMTIIGTAGFMTYLGVTGTLGFIVMATENDQMKRVSWASGIHLRQRWIREEERAFMDEVACAWGFKDPNRRGEEEGVEWNSLKELCGIRGMVLDRVELMPGMQ